MSNQNYHNRLSMNPLIVSIMHCGFKRENMFWQPIGQCCNIILDWHTLIELKEIIGRIWKNRSNALISL
jgi:hypothetical protein